MENSNMTIYDAAKGLANKDFSSVELTKMHLDRIHDRNSEINAYITVTDDYALSAAKLADERIAKGEASLLTGIPFGAKDAICIKNVRSTGGATILDNYIPPHTATVIESILDEGAVLLGKQNCDAFGHGASNENSMYGDVANPADETKVAGGSSGGSAAALADGQCIFSIAEDTGGSIRQPASFCGLVGLRPSYGRNSRFGIMPMASSLDTVGPITRSVQDAALLMNVMAGHDSKDCTTVLDAVPDYTKVLNEKKTVTLGIPKEYMSGDGVDPEITERIAKTVKALEDFGINIVEVSLPHTKYAVPTYYIIVPSEDSSNLARLDGMRYGKHIDAESLEASYKATRGQGFPKEVKRRIMVGTYALSAGYYDAYYRKAQKVRTLIRQDFDIVFEKVDALLTPTTPTTAFGRGEKKDDVMSMYKADVFAAAASLSGLPALSVPVGLSKSGLPIGAQVIGPRLQEETVLHIGSLIEQLNIH